MRVYVAAFKDKTLEQEIKDNINDLGDEVVATLTTKSSTLIDLVVIENKDSLNDHEQASSSKVKKLYDFIQDEANLHIPVRTAKSYLSKYSEIRITKTEEFKDNVSIPKERYHGFKWTQVIKQMKGMSSKALGKFDFTMDGRQVQYEPVDFTDRYLGYTSDHKLVIGARIKVKDIERGSYVGDSISLIAIELQVNSNMSNSDSKYLTIKDFDASIPMKVTNWEKSIFAAFESVYGKANIVHLSSNFDDGTHEFAKLGARYDKVKEKKKMVGGNLRPCESYCNGLVSMLKVNTTEAVKTAAHASCMKNTRNLCKK